MQMLAPRLDFGTIARNPMESVRPDLWPDYAIVPAYGNQGASLRDLSHGQPASSLINGTWSADEAVFNGTSTKVLLPTSLPLPGTGAFWFAARFRVATLATTSNFVRPYYTWNYGDFGAYVSTVSGLRVYVRNSSFTLIAAAEETPAIATYSVAARRNSAADIEAFVNGEFVGSNSGADININAANAPAIGYLQAGDIYTSGAVSHYYYGVGEISSQQLSELSRDIDIPFRRAPQVSYFVAAGLAIPILINQARRRRT